MSKPKLVKPKAVSKIAKTPAKVFSRKVSPVTIPHKALAGQSSDVVADVIDVILSEEITSLELQYADVCRNKKATVDAITKLLAEYRDGVVAKLLEVLSPIERKFTSIEMTLCLFIKKGYRIGTGEIQTTTTDYMIKAWRHGRPEYVEITVDELKTSIPTLEELVAKLHQLFAEDDALSERLRELRKRKDNAGIIVKRHKIANEYKIDDKSMGELKTMILGERK